MVCVFNTKPLLFLAWFTVTLFTSLTPFWILTNVRRKSGDIFKNWNILNITLKLRQVILLIFLFPSCDDLFIFLILSFKPRYLKSDYRFKVTRVLPLWDISLLILFRWLQLEVCQLCTPWEKVFHAESPKMRPAQIRGFKKIIWPSVCDLASSHCEVRETRSSQGKLNEFYHLNFGTIWLLGHTAQDTPVPADAMTAQLMEVSDECRMSPSSVSSVAPFLMVHFILQGWECSHFIPFPSLVWKLRSRIIFLQWLNWIGFWCFMQIHKPLS